MPILIACFAIREILTRNMLLKNSLTARKRNPQKQANRDPKILIWCNWLFLLIKSVWLLALRYKKTGQKMKKK